MQKKKGNASGNNGETRGNAATETKLGKRRNDKDLAIKVTRGNNKVSAASGSI